MYECLLKPAENYSHLGMNSDYVHEANQPFALELLRI